MPRRSVDPNMWNITQLRLDFDISTNGNVENGQG